MRSYEIRRPTANAPGRKRGFPERASSASLLQRKKGSAALVAFPKLFDTEPGLFEALYEKPEKPSPQIGFHSLQIFPGNLEGFRRHHGFRPETSELASSEYVLYRPGIDISLEAIPNILQPSFKVLESPFLPAKIPQGSLIEGIGIPVAHHRLLGFLAKPLNLRSEFLKMPFFFLQNTGILPKGFPKLLKTLTQALKPPLESALLRLTFSQGPPNLFGFPKHRIGGKHAPPKGLFGLFVSGADLLLPMALLPKRSFQKAFLFLQAVFLFQGGFEFLL